MIKKVFLFFGAVLIFALAACGGQAQTDDPLPKIVVSNNGAASQAPIYIAHAEGYFTEQGLDVELISMTRTSEAVAGMISGDIDVVPASNSVAILNAVAFSEGIKVVADRGHISKDTCTYYGMLIGKELYDSGVVTGPADFTDYNIRSSGVGVGAWFLELYIAQAGLTLDDLDLSNIPESIAEDALTNQSIAASGMVEPRLTGAIISGAGVMVAGLEDFVDDFQISIMAFGKRLTIEDRDLGLRFMAGYLQGVKQYNEGKTPRNLEILSEYTEMAQEELELACWPSIWDDGHITYDTFLDYQEWAISIGDLESVVPEEIYWDPYFVEEAYKRINE